MKNVVILGSTGSIGRQALNFISKSRDDFKVCGLVANSNAELLAQQSKEFSPEFIGLCDPKDKKAATAFFSDQKVKPVFGQEVLTEAARLKSADIVLAAIVGMCGLESVLEAAKCKKDIALANKEALVAGGKLVIDAVNKAKVNLYPVDSEHSAVWQVINGGRREDLKRIILTASGGKFLRRKAHELENVTIEEATTHPNWSMGKKITVDSSTMMNKGLEIIEARWLFDTEDIDYIIHPESIIHSMVEFKDGSVLAQMSNPDMKIPIALALSYPKRYFTNVTPLDFTKNLTFLQPDEETFFMPKLAKQALKVGGNAPCILNSANEAAVELFLSGRIGFLQIQKIVADTLNNTEIIFDFGLSDIIQTHKHIYNKLMRDYN